MNLDETSDLGYQHLSFLVPIRLNQTAGLSVIGVGSSIDEMTISRLGSTITPTGNRLHYGDMWVVGHYAARLRPWLMIGANPKVFVQNQFSGGGASHRQISGALDAGIYLNPFDHYRFGDLGFSLSFQDLVPAHIKWEHQQVTTNSTTMQPETTMVSTNQLLTTRFRAGLRYAAFNDKLVMGAELVVDNALIDLWQNVYTAAFDNNGDETYSEFAQKIGRFGFNAEYEFIPQVWIKAGWSNNSIPYCGFSMNVIYPLPEMINYARFDMHVGYSLNERERGLTFMTKLATDFGYTREQRESRHLYNVLIMGPMTAYLEAMKLYSDKKYWEASFAFGKVLALYPNFHLNDRATYYMGDCYSKLRMNDIARETFKGGLAEYTTSEVRANYLYGLQELDYREGGYENALKNHAFITNLYAEHEIKPDADYLAGQIHYLKKNYNAAEMLLAGIKPKDSVYMYAQYTLAVLNVDNNKSKAAIQNLNAIIADTTTDAGILLLQDAANNKLGQLYFEEVELRKAVEAFSQVPEGSPFGDEAQMGIAWSWIKVNRPEEALKAINNLIVTQTASPLIPEAYLVKGYALMLLKRNPEAKTALETCMEMCKKDFASEDDLKARRGKFDQYLQQFAPTSEKIRKNALRKPTDKTMAERADMKSEFDKFSKEAKDFFEFTLQVQSNKEFFRRKDQVLTDAEYALAKVTKLIGGTKETQILQEQNKKATQIDSEIERLKRQLEEEQQKSE
jgi:tetratricopeptide (TPR) repeat protein